MAFARPVSISSNFLFTLCRYVRFAVVVYTSIIILIMWCFVQVVNGRLRIAVIGQSQFAVEVYKLLRQKHDIVGVFTIPDVNGRPDPLGKEHRFSPMFKFNGPWTPKLTYTFPNKAQFLDNFDCNIAPSILSAWRNLHL